MVTMVDPPGGWAYGFPQPLQGDYEKQLRDAGYPESDIPLALNHSWYHTVSDMTPADVKAEYGIDVGQPGGDHTAFTEFYKDCFTGTASDGDDGA